MWAKNNVNIKSFPTNKKKKKNQRPNPSPIGPTPAPEKQESCDSGALAFAIIAGEGCSYPGDTGEGGQAKKPPKRHRCYQEQETRPMPTPGKEPIPALQFPSSLERRVGNRWIIVTGKFMTGNLWMPSTFFPMPFLLQSQTLPIFFIEKMNFFFFNIVN